MGIPKKKSRRIVVDGRKFLYLVKETRGLEDHDHKLLCVTVQEDADRPGRVMQFWYPHGVAVEPSVVHEGIVTALSAGWDPEERGGAFVHEHPYYDREYLAGFGT